MSDEDATTGERKVAPTSTFFVFGASSDMLELGYIGSVAARNRDHAIRLMFPDPTEGHEGNIVAVSEAAWKPFKRVLEAKPVAKLNPVSMPSVGSRRSEATVAA